jgi:hypothetical protein
MPRDLIKLQDEKYRQFRNTADFKTSFEEQSAELTFADKLKMKIIDDEMRDMVIMSKDTRSAIREMNDAFSGEQETEFIAEEHNNKIKVQKVVTRKRTFDRMKTAKGRPLEPIMELEADLVTNDFALVPVNIGDEKKKRNDSLKHKARLMSGNRSTNPSYLNFGREDTFLTGGGLPGRRSREEDEEEDE